MNTNNPPSIRILLVGDSLVGKTHFINQFIDLIMMNNNNNNFNPSKNINRNNSNSTIGVDIHSHIHQSSSYNNNDQQQASNNNMLFYFVDWFDIGAKHFDVPKANRTFFQSQSYDGIVFMFDLNDVNSLHFWDEKIDPFLSPTTTTSTTTTTAHSNNVEEQQQSRYSPMLQQQQQLNKRWKNTSATTTTGSLFEQNNQVPVLMIGNHSSTSSSGGGASASFDLPMTVGDERGGGGGGGFMAYDISNRRSQSLFGLWPQQLLSCVSIVGKLSFYLLSKLLFMGEYYPSGETSQKQMMSTRAMASRLQQNIFADYLELDSARVTLSQKRLVENFLDRVIAKKQNQR